MGKNNTRILMQFTALAMLLIASIMFKEAESIRLCKINTNDLEKCRPAVTGRNPPPPGPDCCALVKAADLVCACRYKGYLSSYGIDLTKAKAVIASCSARMPPCFRR
ncbi:hypothetical protein AALP_AA8G338900 [Arabis alpina]|uniref:Bifunctional inhibitor/plant lipid transfer protein/seed storage helical domain-containing protein n=1 Tax=Arabis alpina TaxID=50452 RepID=A0A087GB79_ARAAL|nr:hypothetical protein AALP_AA8G338900 [Arabis alpina]